jgi:hypothetical protein
VATAVKESRYVQVDRELRTLAGAHLVRDSLLKKQSQPRFAPELSIFT